MVGALIACVVLCTVLTFAAASAEELPEQYREPFSESFPIRKQQHLELNAFLDTLIERSPDARLEYFEPDSTGLEQYRSSLTPFREQFRRMLGYPPPGVTRDSAPRFELVAKDRLCDIYRTWIEVMEGVEAYGLYMVPRDLEGRAPLLVSVHGGSGCPEAICDLDTREPYHAFGREAVKRGYVVWAPSLLMQVTYGGDPVIEEAHRQLLDRKARLVGTSVVAVEVYKIVRGIESITEHRAEVDSARIGMVGLSYGGYYTLYTTAASELVKAAVCSGYFTDMTERLPRGALDPEKGSDVRFLNILNTFAGAAVVGLICPRPLMIQHGENDSVISIEGTREAVPKAASYYKKLGIEERFESSEHPGGHEFDNESIFDFFSRHL